jgi:hypothetical protein
MANIAMSDRIGHARCNTTEENGHASTTSEVSMARSLADLLFRLGRLQSWLDYERRQPFPNRLVLLRLNLLRLRLRSRLAGLMPGEA